MFARIQTVRTTDVPDDPTGARTRELCDVLRMHPAYAGAYFLTDIVAATRSMITLWRSREEAERSSQRTRDRFGERPFALVADDVLDVVDDRRGPADGQRPGAAGVAEYDGPMSDEHRNAAEEATTGWVGRAWSTVPGAVRLVTMWDPALRVTRVLNLTTTAEEGERSGQVITAAAPATGRAAAAAPQRVSLLRVDHVDGVGHVDHVDGPDRAAAGTG